ncbi:hypothetical protein A2U01_0109214, partial [Trifolium medium]|nr:hypothetical protein [Trifolium medium]
MPIVPNSSDSGTKDQTQKSLVSNAAKTTDDASDPAAQIKA